MLSPSKEHPKHILCRLFVLILYANRFLRLLGEASESCRLGNHCSGGAPMHVNWEDFSGCSGQMVGTDWSHKLKVGKKPACKNRQQLLECAKVKALRMSL